MQQAVDVVEDLPLADRLVAVVGAELGQRPVGDILAAVAAVLVCRYSRGSIGSRSEEGG